jgi:hypothetical protein
LGKGEPGGAAAHQPWMSFLLSILALLAGARFENARRSGNSVMFQLQTETNVLYVLDETNDLAMPWREREIFAGNGSNVELTSALAGGARFFRARAIPQILVSKPGTPLSLSLAISNSTSRQWRLTGELPDGITFADGRFSGTPTAAAAEKYDSGKFTNVVHFAANARDSSAEIVHEVRLSYTRNIHADRPNGPAFGAICIKCHGSGFPPNFSPSATSLLNVKSSSGGACPDTWNYVAPGDVAESLIYQKITAPACGDRMPQGGPFFNDTQINRLARWIAELRPGEAD